MVADETAWLLHPSEARRVSCKHRLDCAALARLLQQRPSHACARNDEQSTPDEVLHRTRLSPSLTSDIAIPLAETSCETRPLPVRCTRSLAHCIVPQHPTGPWARRTSTQPAIDGRTLVNTRFPSTSSSPLPGLRQHGYRHQLQLSRVPHRGR